MFGSDQWLSNPASGFYNGVATQSLRFDQDSSTYLTRTPSSAGDKKTWTWSGWIKRASLVSGSPYGGFGIIFAGGNQQNMWAIPTNCTMIAYWINTEQLVVLGSGNTVLRQTSARQRDLSAWYHFVVAMDTTQSTANDRTKVYINGVQQTSFDTTNNVSQNTDLNINETSNHLIGGQQTSNVASSMNMYLAETNFVDGQALDASYFGETKNGVWIPKKYTGSYGTNGFRLQFNQTGTGTASASTIGADTSGNTNHFTSSGIVASDCNMPDSPENNFPTMNSNNKDSATVLSEGNLKLSNSTVGTVGARSTMATPTSGKYYVEFAPTISGGNWPRVGIARTSVSGNTPETWFDMQNGASNNRGSGGATTGAFSTGDVGAIAFDADAGKIYLAKNNTWQNSGDPVNGTGYMFDGLTDGPFLFSSYQYHSANVIVWNFGQDSSFAGTETAQGNTDGNGIGDFYYAPPSGFLALCSANLPEPTISPNADTQADDYFNTVLRSGFGSSGGSVTVGFKPDWVWEKTRNATSNHTLWDSSRGLPKHLYTNATAVEGDSTWLTAFASNGLTYGTNDYGSSTSLVVWNWKAGGATPSKTYKVVVVSDSGNKYRFRNSADSATFGASAVTLYLQEGGTYTFDYSDSTATSHPFRFSTTSDGTHGGGSEYTTGVVKDDTAKTITITVASSAPTLYYYCSSHSGMGGQVNTNATSGQTNFDGSLLSVSNANTDAGFSIVTYTGNGSAGATYGHGLGAVPAMIITKGRNVADNWMTRHKDYSANTSFIELNTSNAEGNATDVWNNTAPTSSVITVGTGGTVNSNTKLYVSYCFAEIESYSRFGKYTGNGSANGTFVFTGFRPAWIMVKTTGISSDWVIEDTTRSPFNESNATLFANLSNAEYTAGAYGVDLLSNGFKIYNTYNQWNASGQGYIYMAFAESPFKYANAR